MSTQPLRFKNQDGRYFTVRLLRKNEMYGDDEAFIYDADEPSLEFFDASGFDWQEEPEIYGYFTGIRCRVSEVFVEKIEKDMPINNHLLTWNISEYDISAIQHWLINQLDVDEQQFIDKRFLNCTQIILPDTPFLDQCSEEEDETVPSFLQSSCYDPANFAEMGEFEEEDNEEDNLDEASQMDKISFLQQELAAALRALDLAEAADNRWKVGDVQVRIHVLAAKQQILKAISLINESF